jgi:hypothetical protein
VGTLRVRLGGASTLRGDVSLRSREPRMPRRLRGTSDLRIHVPGACLAAFAEQVILCGEADHSPCGARGQTTGVRMGHPGRSPHSSPGPDFPGSHGPKEPGGKDPVSNRTHKVALKRRPKQLPNLQKVIYYP